MLELRDTAIHTPGHVTVLPLLAPKFDDLPPTFLQICGLDPLRGKDLASAHALESAGYAILRNYSCLFLGG